MWSVNSTSISYCDVISNNSTRFCGVNYSEPWLSVGKSGHCTGTITNLCTHSGECFFLDTFFIILLCKFSCWRFIFRIISINIIGFAGSLLLLLLLSVKIHFALFTSVAGHSHNATSFVGSVCGFSCHSIDNTFQLSYRIE